MNKKQKKNFKVLTGVFAAAAGLVVAGAASASPVFAHPQSLHNGIFHTDFASFAELEDYAGELNAVMNEESIVLLKNKDNALPLAKGSTISLLGIHSYVPFAGGGGSGSGSGAKDTIPGSLRNFGFQLNGAVEQFYDSHRYTAQLATGMGQTNVNYDGPTSELDLVKDSFQLFGDTAVITLGRVGAEGGDLFRRNLPSQVAADPTRHILQLFDNEKELIQLAKEQCEKVVILLNTANVMEVGELEDDPDIDAVLWIGQPGSTGLRYIGRVLCGDTSPSGRLADIWPANLKKDPTWFNFGDNSQNNTYDPVEKTWTTDFNNGHRTALIEGSKVATGNKNTLEEEENIYVGYKWYETANEEGFITDYYNRDNGVVYPFGYGLSYTSFSQELVSTAAEIQDAINGATKLDQKIKVKVKVTNTGEVAGKDVAELYWSPKYIDGGIEKASVNLVSFAKTKVLKPGASQVLSLDVRIGDLASFDYNDANHNNFSGWEIEAGESSLKLMKNSHEVIASAAVNATAKEFKRDGSVATAALAEEDNYNYFSKGDDYDTLLPMKKHEAGVDGVTMHMLSRSDFAGTFPDAPTVAERTYPDVVNALLTNNGQAAGTSSITDPEAQGYNAFSKYYRYTAYFNSSDDLPTDPWYRTNADIPAEWTQAANTEGRTDGKVAVQLNQMSGLDYDDNVSLVPEGHPYAGKTHAAAWIEFMNQLTYEELCALFANGGYRTPGLGSIGKKQAGDQDGPAQLKGTGNGGQYTSNANQAGLFWTCETNIASTWDVTLAHKQGIVVGNESLFNGSNGWYGPAMNTHRSAFAGRNFEYYSQDGVHAGFIAAAVVSGAQSKGCNVYLKHFAMNDQETDRSGLGTFNSEQAMREIYFKPFEYSVKDGNATAFMSAFNRVGAINSFGNYPLLNSLLREEWGFKGAGVTDFYNAGLAKANYMQRGGTEMPLNTGHPYAANQTGIASTQNRMTGIWDATLRDGKGGVRDGLSAGDPAVIPESPTQYWTVRMSAMRIAWVGANTNNNQNGIDVVDSSLRAINLFTFEAQQTLETGVAANINVGLSDEVLKGNAVRYELNNELPEGLSFNASTGVISGRTTAVGVYNFTVRAIIDNYILRTASLRITVVPNVTVAVGESFEKAIQGYKVGDDYNGHTLTAVNPLQVNGAPEGVSVITVSAEEATEERPAGMYLAGSIAEAGTYSISTSQRITYRDGSRNRNVTVNSSVTVVVTGEVGPQPVVHGGIVSSVINDEGHLVITYEDGAVVDLGLVVGADGQPGAQGPAGADGKDGVDGKDGKDGVDGKDGQPGAQGPQGEQGPAGPQGPAGADGKDGKDGVDAKGCGGSIAAASGIMALIAGLGLAVISIRKNRKED